MSRYIIACIAATASIVILWRSHQSVANVAQSKPTPIANYAPTPTILKQKETLPITSPADALDKILPLLKLAKAGDRDAQFKIAKIMRSCPNYTHTDGTRMSFEETIAEYRVRGSEVENIHRAFEQCSRMWKADDLGTAGEWLALATKAKQPQAMALTAEDLLWNMNRNAMFHNALAGVNPEPVVTDPALDTTLDPRKLLLEAIPSNNPDVYYAIAHNALLLFPGNPDALTLYYSWMLVACQRGLDCSKNSELAGFNCSHNIDACNQFKSPGDYALWLASNDRVDLSQVETHAADITANLDAGQYDSLGLGAQ